MVVNEFWVLLLGVKKGKLGIRLEKNTYRKKEDNLAETDWGSYYNQEEWLETVTATLLKTDFNTGVFLWNLRTF